MNKMELLYMVLLLCSWAVDLHHWDKWGELDEKYGMEAVQRREERDTYRRVVLAMKSIAISLISSIRKIFH